MRNGQETNLYQKSNFKRDSPDDTLTTKRLSHLENWGHNKTMKTLVSQAAPVGRAYEDSLSTEELRELVSSPGASNIAGAADEVCDRVFILLTASRR